MVAASELHGDFVLSSGQRSSIYFDKFRFLTDPGLLRDVAKSTAALLPDGVTALGAPEGAAMLLVAAVSLETGLPVTVVRRQAKEYGTGNRLEGAFETGGDGRLDRGRLHDRTAGATGSGGPASGRCRDRGDHPRDRSRGRRPSPSGRVRGARGRGAAAERLSE